MAIASTTAWEVRTDGDDTNAGAYNSARSGATTDYTYPTSTVYTYADLAATTATTTPALTSVARPFVAADVGNHIRISAGTNWTTGVYEIVSVAAGAATLDRACGSSATLSSGSGKLGGALASPGLAGAGMVGGNTLHLKAGTYTLTSASSNVSGGRLTLPTASSMAFPTRLSGYQTTRNDRPTSGNRPVITNDGALGGSSAGMITATSNYCLIERAKITLTNLVNWSGINGGASCIVRDCDVTNFAPSGRYGITAGSIRRCYVENCSIGILASVRTDVVNCTLKDCTTFINPSGSQIRSTARGCLFIGTGACQVITNSTDSSCDYMDCYLSGARWTIAAQSTPIPFAVSVQDCVQWGSSTYGVDSSLVDAIPGVTFLRNFMGGNTSGNINGVLPTSGANQMLFSNTTLTANPFVNPAGGNYAINNVAGGGALVKQSSYTLPGTNTTIYPNPRMGGGANTRIGIGI